MLTHAREAMKDTLMSLLNSCLLKQGHATLRVVDLSDDFETATVMHLDGTQMHVKAELLIPEQGDDHEKEEKREARIHNRGANAEQVARIRSRRVHGYENRAEGRPSTPTADK